MFGRKQKSIDIIEVSESEKDAINIEPYDDEPSAWKNFSEEQLVQTWYRLALTYADSNPAEPTTGNGMQWYLDQANSGNPSAQYALGKMYYKGICMNRNFVQASMWYSKASDIGSPFADYELAKMFKLGEGMAFDMVTSESLFERAFVSLQEYENISPNEAIEVKLAVICENHLTGQADPSMAANWRELAGVHGKAQAVTDEPPILELTIPTSETKNKVDNKTISCVNNRSGKSEEVPIKYIVLAKKNCYADKDTEEELHALAMSIQTNGLINPVTLNKISETEYQMIAGEKRYKAITRYLNWDTIPSTVYEHLSPNAAQLMLHTANLDVREYTAGQKLQFYIEADQLLDKMKESGEYSGSIQKGISELLGISTH